MKEILKRGITGIVYVLLLLSAVFLNSDAFDFLFMAFGLACLFEYKRIVKLKGYYVFVAYLALWWAYIYLIKSDWIINVLLVATLLIDFFLLYFLFSKKEITFKPLHKFLIALFFLGGGCIFLTMIPYRGGGFEKILIMGIFILIWVNDSFAYLVGRKLGRTKLFPSVSPKKTIEGAAGGLIFALIAAYIISIFETNLSIIQWFILATVIVVTGNLGDLIESKFKRKANVKDSGAILPGHGGIWDRLDSLVFAAPFAFLTLIIFSHVS
ncbi:MAG: phosphatidate cytidylyltransferase [Cellulophaga fucicola]